MDFLRWLGCVYGRAPCQCPLSQYQHEPQPGDPAAVAGGVSPGAESPTGTTGERRAAAVCRFHDMGCDPEPETNNNNNNREREKGEGEGAPSPSLYSPQSYPTKAPNCSHQSAKKTTQNQIFLDIARKQSNSLEKLGLYSEVYKSLYSACCEETNLMTFQKLEY